MVADALSRIGEKWLPPEETDAIFRATPLLEGNQTVVFNEKEEDKAPERDPKWTMSKDQMKAVFNEKEEDKAPERDPKWTMSKDEMKAVFDNLMMGTGRRAE